ncbi:unnamed protein product [Moneuplotes crassus]|uniref:Uncharacterized protein n=1 Tax=Euplotes crassus TaxID=5936 RepID=A0AAD1X4C6_EUPCR|nr:unnamed protein product [Moneuplotes crassus]
MILCREKVCRTYKNIRTHHGFCRLNKLSYNMHCNSQIFRKLLNINQIFPNPYSGKVIWDNNIRNLLKKVGLTYYGLFFCHQI